jgi:DnaK suppressor protein
MKRTPAKATTSIQDRRLKLTEKARQLQAAVQIEDIAIERNAELGDEIQRLSEREIALQRMSRNWETAAQVRSALDRIQKGTYGICEECEEPIGDRRLNAIPWASLCIRCQTALDAQSAPRWQEAA